MDQQDEESGKPPEMVQPKNPSEQTIYGFPIKHVVLVLLTVQNAGAVLLMRYTRSIPGETEFNTQTVSGGGRHTEGSPLPL